MTRQGALLIVDDNEMNRDALSRRLTQKGYAVTLASSGQEALAAVAASRFDLVLLDVEMPEMSGLEVLGRLRHAYSQTQLPVIMVTARTQGADIVEAFRLGANDYVTKPIDFPVALARIGTHLAHKWAVEDLRDSEERYELAMRGANDGLWDWNLVTDQVHWSTRWKAMLGFKDGEIGASPDEWLTRVHPEDVDRVRVALMEHLGDRTAHYESEHRLLHRDGTYRWVLCRGAAVRHGGRATRIVGSLSDVTDTKVADALTGLPNRLLFVDLLDRALKRARRRPDYGFALLVLGLDRFTVVKDSLGSLTADRLLVAVARRLQSSLRATDAVTANPPRSTLARLGGDEFTILVDDIVDAGAAVRVAERVRQALQEPFELDGHQVYTTATIGIAVSSTGYKEPDEILRDAATALHRAKANGATPLEVFDQAMRARAISQLQLETDLRAAIADRAFLVHYQPIVCLRTGSIAGLEALVRWRHPTRGVVNPADFIPVAEDTGMLLDIGRFVLMEACRQMARWRKRFSADAPRVMCVNVSCRQFAQADLIAEIESILRDSGLESTALHLEITESAFMGDVRGAHATLNKLQSLGIEWSIDDFGTGYSSLSYLHRLQAGTVKIDRSFVSRLDHERRGAEMVSAIVGLAHNFAMDVVAEGVETAQQLACVRDLGSDYAQGFYLSKPVEAAAIERLIATQPWRYLADGPAIPLPGSDAIN